MKEEEYASFSWKQFKLKWFKRASFNKSVINKPITPTRFPHFKNRVGKSNTLNPTFPCFAFFSVIELSLRRAKNRWEKKIKQCTTKKRKKWNKIYIYWEICFGFCGNRKPVWAYITINLFTGFVPNGRALAWIINQAVSLTCEQDMLGIREKTKLL